MKTVSRFCFIILVMLSFSKNSYSQPISKFINPTGTYSLKSKTVKRNGETYGYSGKIQVLLIDSNQIKMTFFVTRGAPGYNSGSFVETLYYNGSKAVYTDSDSINDCMTSFIFNSHGVDVFENPEVKQLCWGYGVVATGHYKKKSSKKPVLMHPLTGKKIL
jgi:hypothetical protein